MYKNQFVRESGFSRNKKARRGKKKIKKMGQRIGNEWTHFSLPPPRRRVAFSFSLRHGG